jgi:UDP-N-acetyl-D-mannosaminuronate dehydrogenase
LCSREKRDKKVLEVSFSRDCAWRQRSPSGREMANRELVKRIEAVYNENHGVFGILNLFGRGGLMKISVFGLGYVGSVSAACLAALGHEVIGVDVNPMKVDMINAGQSPVIEAGLDALIAEGVEAGRLSADIGAGEAIAASDASIICVGTPSDSNGNLNLAFVERVCREIGQALASKEDYHIVVVRSTMLPGSTEERVIPILESAPM